MPPGPPLCLWCGLSRDHQPTDDMLQDVVTRYRISSTEVWIFPTCLFNAAGMGYWLLAPEEHGGYPFMEVYRPDDPEHAQASGQACDALVDSANNFLIAGSGLARRLHDDLGEPYQQAKQALLARNHGELVHGQAYFLPLAGPARRITKGIIEAISIRYCRGEGGALQRLDTRDTHVRSCVVNALSLAHEQACRSIAIPQFASRPGYSVYPGAMASAVMVNAMLNAIATYLCDEPCTSLQRICLHPSDLESELQMVMFFNRLSG